MLIRFSVENFLSFKKKTTLEMFASKKNTPEDQVVEFLKDNKKSSFIPKILKSAFIFGPNAAGKSNLITAIDFARSLILRKQHNLGSRILYFRLCQDCHKKPSFFEFEFVQNMKIYKYGFRLQNSVILEEWLYQILSTKEENIFHRHYNTKDKNVVKFGPKYEETWEKDPVRKSFWVGTPENVLFLSESVVRNQDDFLDVLNWFKKISVIYPESNFTSYNVLIKNKELVDLYTRVLRSSDIGIDSLDIERVNADDVLNKLPKQFTNSFDTKDDVAVPLAFDTRYLYLKHKGLSEAYRIAIKHQIPDTSDSVTFSIEEESQGSNRLFDLIPFLDIIRFDKIILIDEFERSLHPKLTKHLVDMFFDLNKNHKAQLITTTHDVTLLDVSLIRRDSIWFCRKNREMSTILYSLEEYKVRNDRVLQKAYLNGLYGAVPIIQGE